MEHQDERILGALQRNSRQTNQELAEMVGMSTSACWRRVRALEDAGVIKGYTALVDREKAGFAFAAIIHASLERHDERYIEQFVSRVRTRPEITECTATTGNADYHLHVAVRDIAAFNEFLDSFMFKLPGLHSVHTNVILKEIKASAPLPFP